MDASQFASDRLLSWGYVTATGFNDEPIFRLLCGLRKIDFEFAGRAVAFLIRRYEREVVTAAQMIHQSLKCNAQIVGLIRKNFAASFICQRLEVHVRSAAKFAHPGGPHHDSVLDSLAHLPGNYAANDTAR